MIAHSFADEVPTSLSVDQVVRVGLDLSTGTGEELVEAVHLLTKAVEPIIPASASALLAVIEAGKGGAPISQPTPLFPRLELPSEKEEPA